MQNNGTQQKKGNRYLQDDNGNQSSARLSSLICTYSGVGIALATVTCCLIHGDYTHPVEIIGILGSLGLGHKVNSVWKERGKRGG